MENTLNRRDFLGTMGVMSAMGAVMGMAPMGMGSAPTAAQASEATAAPEPTWVTGNPNNGYYDTFSHLENPVMTREEALDYLYNPVRATNDLVLDDGTVVPAVYLDLRNRWNRIGVGTGSQVDTSKNYWARLMYLYTPEEAEQYMELPIYSVFTAAMYAEQSGRTTREATEICDNFAKKGVLPRFTRGGVPHYYLTNQWLGANMHANDPEVSPLPGPNAPDWSGAQYDGGTPIYQVVPVSEEVVADTHILPLDDWKAVIERNDKFVIVPCACRAGMAAAQKDFEYMEGKIWDTRLKDENGHNFRINTCLAMGEFAEYYLWLGYGWEVTKEEALRSCEMSVDEGMVIEHFYSKTSEIICNCHCDCCNLLGAWRACDGVGDCFTTISNYDLVVDTDACIQCGACIERCTMHSVTFDSDGFPTIDTACARCGSCVLTCPAGARSLVARAKELRDDAPETTWDDWSEKPIYRAMKGQLVDFVG